MSFPPQALFVVVLDLLVLAGWIVILARADSLLRHIAMLAASTAVWFIGLGLALWHMRQAGLTAETAGISDPATLSRHMSDALVLAAAATKGFFYLLIVAAIAFAIRRDSRKAEVAYERE